MHDHFAEALDKVTVCIMTRSDAQRFLLADQEPAAQGLIHLGRGRVTILGLLGLTKETGES